MRHRNLFDAKCRHLEIHFEQITSKNNNFQLLALASDLCTRKYPLNSESLKLHSLGIRIHWKHKVRKFKHKKKINFSLIVYDTNFWDFSHIAQGCHVVLRAMRDFVYRDQLFSANICPILWESTHCHILKPHAQMRWFLSFLSLFVSLPST